MATTEETFDVQQSQLFDALVDPETYPRWLIGARRIRSISEDWPHPRSFFEHTVGFGPWTIADSTTVRSIGSPQSLELLVRARPLMEATVSFEIEAEPAGCRLRMSETPTGIYRIISAAAQPLIAARNRQSLRRLKAFVESANNDVEA